jgi:uncharacterized phage-associated protein
MANEPTASVFSVARYIRERLGAPDAWKLQKLAYYAQAWSLVWRGRPAFAERIEAWKDGPVCPELRNAQQYGGGDRIRGAAQLSEDDRAHVDRVLASYGGMSSKQLVDLSHEERPWRDARGDVPADARTSTEITHAVMARYYSDQWAEAEADRAATERPAWSGSATDLDALIDTMD